MNLKSVSIELITRETDETFVAWAFQFGDKWGISRRKNLTAAMNHPLHTFDGRDEALSYVKLAEEVQQAVAGAGLGDANDTTFILNGFWFWVVGDFTLISRFFDDTWIVQQSSTKRVIGERVDLETALALIKSWQ
jgi:hypothetical protein